MLDTNKTNIEHFFKKNPCFVAGVFVVLALCAMQVYAGDGIIITPHDQLDGELMVYVLHARHPFDSLYPEILGGLSSSNMVMASPATVFLYMLFGERGGFVSNWCFVAIVSYIGLFYCLRDFGIRPWVCALVSTLYICLPFYSVYGLTAMGVPLIVLSARLAMKKQMLPAIALTTLYGAFSSPFLCGFAVIVGLLIACIVFTLAHRIQDAAHIAAIMSVLIAVYLVANAYALIGLLSSNPTQRSEFELTATAFSWRTVASLYFDGLNNAGRAFYHAEAAQGALSRFCLISTFIIVIAAVAQRAPGRQDAQNRGRNVFLAWLIGLQATAFAIAVFYCWFRCPFAIGLRESLPGAIRTFQADRLHWLYPAIWYISLGITIESLLELATPRKWATLIVALAIAYPCAATLSFDADQSDSFATAKTVLGWGEPTAKVSWSSFFAENTFNAAYTSSSGLTQGETVVSIGMHPSVAMFNGLRCLDGYSNSYPLSYKHEFREVIKCELACDEGLRDYFDKWGNRCYTFSHEVGQNYLVRAESEMRICDLRLNIEALSSMGCHYILSAVEISDCTDYGLKFEGSFHEGNDVYELFVYRV